MGSVKVSVFLQGELIAAIDKIAKKASRSRSELLREAARLYVERQQKWKEIFSFAQKVAREWELTEEDVTAEIQVHRKEKAKVEKAS